MIIMVLLTKYTGLQSLSYTSKDNYGDEGLVVLGIP